MPIPGSGTIFCGFAPSMEALIAARAVAGMGGGGLVQNIKIEISSMRLICILSVMTGSATFISAPRVLTDLVSSQFLASP